MTNIILYIISALILLFVGTKQLKYFRQTQKSRTTLKNIFPADPGNELLTEKNEAGELQVVYEESAKISPVFKDIIDAINNYMGRNNGSADYSVLKDMADRQCDAVEEQIDTNAPVPIYLGLCGTLAGIVIGVAVLGFGGGIDALLTTSEKVEEVDSIRNAWTLTYSEGQKVTAEDTGKTYVLEDGNWVETSDLGAIGIKNLLSGVAIAMLSTLFGVYLTIKGSNTYKEAARENERKKNLFLNWVHGELMPQMKHDTESVLTKLEQNLTRFNTDFSRNTQNLNRIFDGITTTMHGEAEVLRLIERMDINEIATANVNVLRELRECTEEIGTLKEFIRQSNEYLTSVEALNKNLKDQYDRTQLIENMGKFFQDEIKQIEQRKSAIAKAVTDVDLEVQKSLEGLQEHTKKQYGDLTKATTDQNKNLLDAVDAQQRALEAKLAETTQLIDELKNLTAVKENMGHLVEKAGALSDAVKSLGETGKSQEKKLAELGARMAQMIENGSSQQRLMSEAGGEGKIYVNQNLEIPTWAKITGAATCATTIATCILIILKVVFHIF